MEAPMGYRHPDERVVLVYRPERLPDELGRGCALAVD